MASKAPNNGWWRGGVIYQIYPRSYQDSNGDGIGDLPGITRRLEHIAALGADGIWLSPFFKSPMKDFGYDVSDYCDVDPMFGTLDDFKTLVHRAHELGLKVMIDQVLSHHPLRGFDSIHLASALVLHDAAPQELLFACFDKTLVQAAVAEGLSPLP